MSASDSGERASYEYRSLPAGKWIRLLQLHPGRFNEPIEVELVLANLDDDPVYEAISYVWGDPKDRREVAVVPAVVSVTVSLFEGLRRFRNDAEARILWADAICINQNDKHEKGRQVNMMGEIYSKAARVLVWLVEDAHGDAADAFGLIRDFNSFIAQHTTRPSTYPKHIYNFAQLLPPIAPDHPLADVERWKAVVQLFEAQWWSRTWTLQEVGLATYADVYYGSHIMPLSQIVQLAVITPIMEDLPPAGIVPRTGPVGDAWAQIWCSFGKTDSWLTELSPLAEYSQDYFASKTTATFLSVLVAGRKFGATDQRDHVYAFLGHPLARRPDTDQLMVDADYHRDQAELDRLVAARLIRYTQSVELLLYVEHGSKDEMENASWVPKWRTHEHHIFPLIRGTFNAGTASANFSIDFEEPTGTSLRVPALVLGDIELISPMMGRRQGDLFFQFHEQIDPGSPIPNLAEVHPVESLWYLATASPTSGKSVYPNRASAFAQTLGAGFYALESMAHEDFLSFVVEKCGLSFYRHMLSVLWPPSRHHIGTPSERRIWRARPWSHFMDRGMGSCVGRKFFVLERGLFGLAPHFAEMGDKVCVLLGARVPFVIRPVSKRDGTTQEQYQLVGPCFLHGAMNGEALVDWKEKRLKHCEIVLV